MGNEGKREAVKDFTPEQVQLAKDFIWEHLENHVQPILIEMAEKTPQQRIEMYEKKIFVRAEANAPNGILAEEKLIIGFGYNHQ